MIFLKVDKKNNWVEIYLIMTYFTVSEFFLSSDFGQLSGNTELDAPMTAKAEQATLLAEQAIINYIGETPDPLTIDSRLKAIILETSYFFYDQKFSLTKQSIGGVTKFYRLPELPVQIKELLTPFVVTSSSNSYGGAV